jgi:serine/threonine protein kinase
VRLADFGFSKRAINSHAEAHTGGGTPLYMAPEMQGTFQDGTYTRSERVIYTEAVDIWAVGIMTFQILAGRPPFCPDEIERYTTSKLRFPTRRLRRAMASDEACHFVQWLITSQPTLRPNARECLENHWLRSHTTLPENPLSSSDSDSERQSPVEELQEASATWASEEDEVSRIRVEEPTAISDKKTAASDAAPLNFAASIAAPTAHLSRPVVVMVDATNRASDAVGTERGVTLGYPDVTVADYAIITMEETHQQNGDTRSSSRNSNDYAYESDISSVPPDSSMEGSTAGSDIAREQEPKGSATTSDIESLFRNRGARRGRITQEVMGKIERPSANTRRSSRDSEESTLRRVYESHQMDDAKVSEVESGLFHFDRAVVDQDSRSGCSGVFRGSGKLNGSQLLQGVEHAIKRLLLSDVNALKEKKDLDRGRRTFEEKPPRTRRFVKWPKMVLFRDSNEPGTIVSLSDSEEKNQDEDDNKIESGESAGGYRRRGDNGASAGGLLTRAALEHLDSQSDAYHRAIEGADGCACNDCQIHRAQRDN